MLRVSGSPIVLGAHHIGALDNMQGGSEPRSVFPSRLGSLSVYFEFYVKGGYFNNSGSK